MSQKNVGSTTRPPIQTKEDVQKYVLHKNPVGYTERAHEALSDKPNIPTQDRIEAPNARHSGFVEATDQSHRPGEFVNFKAPSQDTMSTFAHKLLLIFIHGFKGDEQTFSGFPDFLQNSMSQVPNIQAESIVYPQYETRGDLKQAVENFCTWLSNLVEEQSKVNLPVWVYEFFSPYAHFEENLSLSFHLNFTTISFTFNITIPFLAADVILKYRSLGELGEPTPRILGLLAYDTPYYGLDHHNMVTGAYSHAADMSEKASTTISFLTASALLAQTMWGSTSDETTSKPSITMSSSSKPKSSSKGSGTLFKWATAAAAVGAIGAATYMYREKVSEGMEWVTSHLKYVGVLVDEKEMIKRNIPDKKLGTSRTFISVPPSHMRQYFSPYNCEFNNEIKAHITMFDPAKNHNYFILTEMTNKKLIKILQNFE
ncbi:hypothetical protein G9A89_023658 [Geosiphon pyriformis]|nr:hypothetical protein G9A89_023658 [Geosiphon pyriformis]